MHKTSSNHWCASLAGLGLAMTVASIAAAHSPMGSPDWCAEDRIVTVAEFDWTGRMMLAADTQAVCSDRSGKKSGAVATCTRIPPTHGQFDDDWARGNNQVQAYCGHFGRIYEAGQSELGTVIGLVTGPTSFTDSTHHNDYSRSQGVQGVCLRCEPAFEPVGPIRVPFKR